MPTSVLYHMYIYKYAFVYLFMCLLVLVTSRYYRPRNKLLLECKHKILNLNQQQFGIRWKQLMKYTGPTPETKIHVSKGKTKRFHRHFLVHSSDEALTIANFSGEHAVRLTLSAAFFSIRALCSCTAVSKTSSDKPKRLLFDKTLFRYN